MPIYYNLSGWGYTLDNVDPLNFSVYPSTKIEIPNELAKYFRISDFSIDSLVNSYLYASHPFDFNDPFDCFSNLLDFTKISLETYKRFFCTFANASESYIENLYNSDITKLNKYFIDQFFDFLLSRIGIVSTTIDSENMLMWAHYSYHNGFALVFDVSKLKKLFHGPFPINYVEKAESFDMNQNPHLSILYLTNIKSKCWAYENEWRLIGESMNPMKLPNRSDLNSFVDRKFHYPIESLKEIVLGFDFFSASLWKMNQDGFIIFDFNGYPDLCLRIKVLDFIIENNLHTTLIHLNSNLSFKLVKADIIIKKFNSGNYGYKLKT